MMSANKGAKRKYFVVYSRFFSVELGNTNGSLINNFASSEFRNELTLIETGYLYVTILISPSSPPELEIDKT